MWENSVWSSKEGKGQKNNTWEWTNPYKKAALLPAQKCTASQTGSTFQFSHRDFKRGEKQRKVLAMQYQAVSLSPTCQHFLHFIVLPEV